MDEDSSRARYVERKGGGVHPTVDRKRLNMMMIGFCYATDACTIHISKILLIGFN